MSSSRSVSTTLRQASRSATTTVLLSEHQAACPHILTNGPAQGFDQTSLTPLINLRAYSGRSSLWQPSYKRPCTVGADTGRAINAGLKRAWTINSGVEKRTRELSATYTYVRRDQFQHRTESKNAFSRSPTGRIGISARVTSYRPTARRSVKPPNSILLLPSSRSTLHARFLFRLEHVS